MNKIKVLADSAADMPKWMIDDNKDVLDVVSLGVIKEDKVYRDIEYDPLKLYEEMEAGTVFTTNQVPINEFLEKFEEYAKNGVPVLSLSLSSGISGTYSAAAIACSQVKEKYPDWECEVVDTKCASFGAGFAVYKIIQKLKEIDNLAELTKYAKDICERMHHIVYVDDLQYVVRGGRVSPAAGAIGNALNIKPIIIVDADGNLEVKDKCRGTKKAYKKMLSKLEGQKDESSGDEIAVFYTNNPEEKDKLEGMIKEIYPNTEFLESHVGATIGAHIGPGTLAFAFIGKEKK